MSESALTVAVFGATGAIGAAICRWYLDGGHAVVGISRRAPTTPALSARMRWLVWNQAEPNGGLEALEARSLDAAVWAQGLNMSDDIRAFDLAAHDRLYAANVSHVLLSLQALLKADKLAPNARLCVISSIWQNVARQNKLSYCVTKAALQGLVQSVSVDLGPDGILINAVLPGALDTPMTRANLRPEQIERLEGMTPLGALPALEDVCNLVGFLCSPSNTGITGQFVAADKGFSYAKIL